MYINIYKYIYTCIRSNTDTFFNDMIGDDSEYPKVKLLPGFGKILGEYRTELDKTLQGFCDFFLEKHGKKTKEIQIFNSVLLKVCSR